MNEDADPDHAGHRLAANIRARRENLGLTQKELAERMVTVGYTRFRQQTILRIENLERAVMVPEGQALARCLGTQLEVLTGAGERAREAWTLLDMTRRARAALASLRSLVHDIHGYRKELARLIQQAEGNGYGDELADELAVARRALVDLEGRS